MYALTLKEPLIARQATLSPQELKVEQVATFLEAHPACRIAPVQQAATHLATAAPFDHLSLTPAQHRTDGFFAAILQRQALALHPNPELVGKSADRGGLPERNDKGQ